MAIAEQPAAGRVARPRFSAGGVFRTVRHYGIIPGIPLFVLVTLIFVGAFAPLISPHEPNKQSLLDSNVAPAWTAEGTSNNLLGTDRFGRDQLTRIFYGARISLIVSFVTIAIGGAIGTLVGLTAGYFGGWLDSLLMRIVDVFLAFPGLLLAIVLATVFEPSFTIVILVASLLIWPRFARLVRGDTLGIKPNDFVTYARITGTPTPRILMKHIFPNVIPTLLVLCTWEVGAIILLESSLSFLGAGIPPPNPSWGTMVLDGRGQLEEGWWISLFPGLAIMTTVLSLNLLGDWMRDYLDPKLRHA